MNPFNLRGTILIITLLTLLPLSHGQEVLIDRLMWDPETVTNPDTSMYLAYFSGEAEGHSQILEKITEENDSVPTVAAGTEMWFASMEDFVNHKLGGFHHGHYDPAFGQMPIAFDSVVGGYPMHNGNLGLGIYYQTNKTIPEALGIVSSHPIPEQRWSFLKPHNGDLRFLRKQEDNWFFENEGLDNPLAFVFKIETPKGQYLMAMANGGDHHKSPMGKQNLHFSIFKHSLGHWEFYDRIITDSFLLPWMDVDGDGVPEILYEAHGSIFFGVFSFFPEYKSVITLSGER
ncbi:MAG: hypothetical protein AAGA85_16815 [Bacteroidota bacterium]